MLNDTKLLSSAAWDANSLNDLKAKAGHDPKANIKAVFPITLFWRRRRWNRDGDSARS